MIHLRSAAVSDIPKMMAICAAEQNAPQWTASAYEELMRTPEKALVRLAGREPGEIAGFYVARRLIEHEWELENIAVALVERLNGVGAMLLNDLIAQAAGEKTAQIFLEVRASNVAARRFYERFGWRESGRRMGYYADPVEDAVLYQRDCP